MPPRATRKRPREAPPNIAPSSSARSNRQTVSGSSKLDDGGNLDAIPSTNPLPGTTKAAAATDYDQDESSLSSLDDDAFEDEQPLTKRPKVTDTNQPPNLGSKDGAQTQTHENDDDDDDDDEFEDVQHVPLPTDEPDVAGDLELTLAADNRMSLTNPYGDKKGPSKLGRQTRNATHCMHVQFLLWHNAIRNAWLCDQEVQAIMMSHIPSGLWKDIDGWRLAIGLQNGQDGGVEVKATEAHQKGRTTARKSQRAKAARTNDGGSVAANDVSGDPLEPLLSSLATWWRDRFSVTAPGLRKWGYMDLDRLDVLIKGYDEDPTDEERFGERIGGLPAFRECAQTCQGSRDVGAQLFTALLRALGLEARTIASLQPLGFGWNKLEEAEEERRHHAEAVEPNANTKSEAGKHSQATKSKSERKATATSAKEVNNNTFGAMGNSKPSRPRRAAARKPPVTETEDDDDSESGEPHGVDEETNQTNSSSTTVTTFDRDLEYPHVWTEVLSPATQRYIPIDAIVKGLMGTKREVVEAFAPRGAKADRARQVMAYVVGFSPDGTAKDVTVRYLKGQVYPGRTKGVRFPVEKTPVYGRDGKIKRYDHFDWFKSVMRGYTRGDAKRPLTDADELEEETDLRHLEPVKKEVKAGEETLQYYKDSQEFVLERHLKREEAFKTTAKPVRKFKNKGSRGEEDVYLRADVVTVKSAETWHKQGREPREGEEPLKLVPYRAATLNRKHAIIEAERATGEKVLQGLYSRAQTDWIVPPPIKDGVIPKNDYGNIDLFVPRMCPKGAAHIPYRGAVRVCKRLGVDFAEAVVGFEFGHKMAVPVIHGVVVAEEHHDTVIEELEKDELARQRRDDEKRKAKILGLWRRFLMGLRIVARIKADYGDVDDGGIDVFGKQRAREKGGTMRIEIGDEEVPAGGGEDLAGGFLPDGFEEGEGEDGGEGMPAKMGRSSFFPAVDEADDDGDDDLLVDHG